MYPQNIADWTVSEAEVIHKQQLRANIIMYGCCALQYKKSERGTRMTWLNFDKFVLKVC